MKPAPVSLNVTKILLVVDRHVMFDHVDDHHYDVQHDRHITLHYIIHVYMSTLNHRDYLVDVYIDGHRE